MRLRRARIARRKIRRIALRYQTFVAIVGGVAAVLPMVAVSVGVGGTGASGPGSRTVALVGGFDPSLVQVNANGTLPQTVVPVSLPLPGNELPAPYLVPGGLLGIPGSALRAYRNAADVLAREQPNCHIDWALIASIGRIESNHARGGYVDKNGTTLEPILGPVLNGIGPVAAIPDTDHGRYDLDVVWDRAVGPTQFIPSTWLKYASDGNGDGVFDPSNIYDATLATGRYLCSGGLDLANPDQLRAAIYRYNHSDTYVTVVILWAEAYRNGVRPEPDSQVPVGAPPPPPALPAPPPVDPPDDSPVSMPATLPPETPDPPSSAPASGTPSPSGSTPASPSETPPPSCPSTPSDPSTTSPPSSTSPPGSTTETPSPPPSDGAPPPCLPPSSTPSDGPPSSGPPSTTTSP